MVVRAFLELDLRTISKLEIMRARKKNGTSPILKIHLVVISGDGTLCLMFKDQRLICLGRMMAEM